jgi:phosphinothricin acetyltransferase
MAPRRFRRPALAAGKLHDAMLIRPADPERDAAACAAIYEPYVRDTVISLEADAPNETEMANRMRRHTATHPWLVAELEPGRPIGFAYAVRHRERALYKWAADVTVYVSPEAHRRGVGRALYAALLPRLVRQNIFTACAGITLPNAASVALHEAFGFECVGVYRGIAFKHGAWRDVGWWQAQLAQRPNGAPPEPARP